MIESAQNDQPNPRQQRDDNAVKLLRKLFHDEYCPANDVSFEMKGQVLPLHFFGWLDAEMPTMHAEALCEAAGVETDTWHFVRQLLDSGAAPESTGSIWYTVVLSDRPKPPVALKTINLVCNMTFADGSISTSQAFVASEMIQGPELDDALTVTIVRNNMKALLEAMMATGLAGLHKECKKNVFTSEAAEDPFEVFMGLMIKHVLPMVKPELKPAVTNYMRLAQQCLRPPIPEHVLSAHRARQMKDTAAEAGKPRGGWNVV